MRNSFLYKLKAIVFFYLIIFSGVVKANDTIRLFSLKNYEQNTNNFFDPSSSDYNKPLISHDVIQERVENYKEHLFGKLSPWSENFVTNILNSAPPHDIQSIETFLLNSYKQGCDTDSANSFAENFKPYPCEWFDNVILKKMNLNQFTFPIKYDGSKKAIATDNILARSFPTTDPLFSSYKLAGQGYPFDNLQVSSIWLGSPLYVLGRTNDGLWALTITESGFIAWIPSKKIAFVDDDFISKYIHFVNNYGLRVITHTETNIQDIKSDVSLHTAYIGSIFPAGNNDINKIIFPKRKTNGFAKLTFAQVDNHSSSLFPLSPTPQNFVHLFKELQDRPYGWGGMYFYNDCSQEMQSIFTTFGIWLPRNSADQVSAGDIEDLSMKTTTERINQVFSDAHKLATLVYIKGHIMLYIGNYNYFGISAPTVYNNLWGLRPADNSYRAIIGQASFFPLFSSYLYPEDKNLISLADSQYRPIFKLSFLDKLPQNKPYGIYKSSDDFSENINLRHMILPENLQ